LICWSLASQLKQLTAHHPQFLAVIINHASEVGCCFCLFLDYQHEEMNRTWLEWGNYCVIESDNQQRYALEIGFGSVVMWNSDCIASELSIFTNR
jgi:hypothetical protein